MSSVRAIAQQLKVSPATVSRVINNHPDVDETTRERVLAAINQAGYFPSTGRLQTNVLALAYPDDPVKTEYGSFEPALLAGIMRGMDEHQFDLKLLSIRRDKTPDETYTQFFLRKGVRGVVMRVFRHNRAIISRIAAERFPCVVIAEQFDDADINFIRSDSYPASRRAMEHLLALGHRRIALAIHHVSDSDHMDRRRAYDDAIVNAGLKIDQRMIFEVSAGFNAGEQVLDSMLMMPGKSRPTAVFATNPMTALGVMRRAQERGVSIPRDMSLVGMDDSDTRLHTWPRMTAVCQDATMLGYEAAHWLTRRLQAGERSSTNATMRRLMQTTFEVNGTTAPPSGEAIDVAPGAKAPSQGR
jgi:DNA-binding LacI/PurR family transcriptional regulator